MSRWSFVIVAVLLSIGLYPTNAKSKTEFEIAFKQSNRDKETPAGKRYAREVEDKIFLAVASQSMQTCVSRSRDTVEPAMLVFIISADGKIRRVLSTPGIEYGECIVSQLRLPISVPRPPHDNFAVALGVANHSHAQSKAPPSTASSREEIRSGQHRPRINTDETLMKKDGV